MKEFIKIKLKDTFQKLENLEKDISDLKLSLESLKTDRIYSSSIKKQLLSEYENLLKLKAEIFDLEVDFPRDLYQSITKEISEPETQVSQVTTENSNISKIKKIHRY